jgi:hypothetical protein
MNDMLNFVQKRAPRADYGLFLDAFALLHSLDLGTMLVDTALSTEHAVSKVKYKNMSQARIATSYQTAYTEIFGTTEDKGMSFGKAMSSYSKWHDHDTGGGLIHGIHEGFTDYQRKAVNSESGQTIRWKRRTGWTPEGWHLVKRSRKKKSDHLMVRAFGDSSGIYTG